MKRCITAAVVAALAASLASVPAAANTGGRQGDHAGSERLKIYGLTDGGKLVSFRSDRPSRVYVRGQIDGLDMDTELVGIDFRPATGDLYGLGDQVGSTSCSATAT